MKISPIIICLTSVLMLLPTASWGAESCSPAKKLVQAVNAFYGGEDELTNLIDPKLGVGLKGINGHPDPSEMLYRFETKEHRLPIVEGQVQELERALFWSKNGELCSLYDDGPLPESKDETVSLSVSFQFPFRQKNGFFLVDEIKEGAKDGSKIIKSLAPSGFGFAAPSLKTFVVTPETPEGDIPTLIFLREGQPVNVSISMLNRAQYVRLKDIKSSKVDTLKIQGPYNAFAFFKIDPQQLAAQEATRLKDASKQKN